MEEKKKSTYKKKLDKHAQARIGLGIFDKFVESTFAVLLAFGTKDQKKINVNSKKDTKRIMQEAAAEIKANMRKLMAAEIVIVENDLNDKYAEEYKAIVKDDLR